MAGVTGAVLGLVSRHAETFLKFGIVGTIGFLVDVTLLYLLLDLGAGPYLGRLGSFLGAATTTWFLNRVFTFRDAAPEAHGRQWLRFVAVNTLGALANLGTYGVVLAIGPETGDLAEALPGLGVAAGSIAGLLFNYTLSRRFVFSRAEASRRRRAP